MEAAVDSSRLPRLIPETHSSTQTDMIDHPRYKIEPVQGHQGDSSSIGNWY